MPLVMDTVGQRPSEDTAALKARLGMYAVFSQGKDSLIFVETPLLRCGFRSKGAQLAIHILKQHRRRGEEPVQLWDSLQQAVFLFAEGRNIIRSDELHFSVEYAPRRPLLQGEDSIVFRLSLARDTFIRVSYRFTADRYDFWQRIEFRGLRERLRNPYLLYSIAYKTPQTEPSTELMKPYCALYYKQGDEVEALRPDEDDPEQKSLQGRIRWIAAKGQFFTTLLQGEEAYVAATLTSLPFTDLPSYQLQLQLPLEGEVAQQRWYLGPAHYPLLRSYKEKYEDQLNLGWSFIRYINTGFIIPVFNFLERYIPSYGIIIAILALLVKVILSPLTWRSYLLGVRMQVINELPEVKALEEKYKNDPQKLMMERSLLYQQLGVNPLSGCIPLLLQIPIFFAMTSFFPNAFELRQKGFLWSTDLSSYDDLIGWSFQIPLLGDHISLFALLTGLSTLAYTYFTQQGQSPSMPGLKWLPYLTPVIFFLFLNSYSSALSWYYFVLNLLTIGQTIAMKRFIDKESLIRKLREVQRKKQSKAQVAQQRAQMRRWFKR